MTKPYDARLIGVVAQDQFEVGVSQFCKIAPLVFTDGYRPKLGDFPNDDELWWMLSAPSAFLTQPGRIVSCQVEDAREYDEHDPAKSRYQAQRESVRDLNPREDGFEILTIPSDALENIQDIVSSRYELTCNHFPSSIVLLQWRDNVYGPFSATVRDGKSRLQYQATFTPQSTDMTVYQIARGLFVDTAGPYRLKTSSNISTSQSRRSECSTLHSVDHELILAQGFERILATNPNKLLLEPIDRKLVRYAKQCMKRKNRQLLKTLLVELEVTGKETEEAEELVAAIKHIRSESEKLDAALDTVSKSLLKSGLLGEDRLRQSEQEYAQKYVQERTAELQANIEANVASSRDEIHKVEAELKELQARLKKEETESRAKITAKLEAEKKLAWKEIELKQSKLEEDKDELKRQEELLKKNLEKVTAELREAGDDVVNRFLAIAPLLGNTIQSATSGAPIDSAPIPEQSLDFQEATFNIPKYITADMSIPNESLTEKAFFERFRSVVDDNGFSYRLLDLQRFHLSVKCGDLTVLGGPSGIGKSSLPALYAQALLGSERQNGRNGCLMININPAWMDVRDLLGHLNTLERRFYPAESGLFEHLIYAQEEYLKQSAGTGLYLTCLDEMNLSQVEYYFSDFMMVLERRGEDRAIRSFSEETIDNQCPFRTWGRVTLPPSLRFVGTVNFDETTRLLSDRLLDRVNLIRLASDRLPGISGSDSIKLGIAEGRMVTLADFQAWQRDAALPSELASLLDELRPYLTMMGCALSPRVYRAICRYVSSAASIMPSGIAFDTQLAQRVIPKIRNLVTKSQLDGLDSLTQTLEASSVGTFEESQSLLKEVRESAQNRQWDLED